MVNILVIIDNDKNQKELSSSSGNEKEFRESLLEALENISSFEDSLEYSETTLVSWARVFPEQAKDFVKSQSKKIHPIN